MKIFERLVLKNIISTVSYRLAYRAIGQLMTLLLCLHSILQYLATPGTYVRALFVDYKSGFNTIVPVKLFGKLEQLGVHHSLALWIWDFLQNRSQVVKINNMISSPIEQ